MTPRPELLGLLDDIRQQPDDPSLRLILADWLEDHAQHPADRARAEILRYQARGGAEPEVRRLQAMHGRAWLGPLEVFCQLVSCRGGLLSVRVAGPSLVSQEFQKLLHTENWAWVDELEIRPPLPARLPPPTLLQRISSLILPQMPAHAPVRIWVRSGGLQGVRQLDLSGWHGSFAEVQSIFDPLLLPGLRDLIYSHTVHSSRVVRAMLRLRLRRLVLSRAMLGDAEVEQLTQEPHLASVQELDLTDNAITDAGAFALADSPYLTHVQVLTLFGNPFGVDGRRRLRERFGARVLFVG